MLTTSQTEALALLHTPQRVSAANVWKCDKRGRWKEIRGIATNIATHRCLPRLLTACSLMARWPQGASSRQHCLWLLHLVPLPRAAQLQVQPRPGCGARAGLCQGNAGAGVTGCTSGCTRVGDTDTAETPMWRSFVQESGTGNRVMSPTKMWAGGALPIHSGMALLYHRLEIQAYLISCPDLTVLFIFWQLLREGLHLFTCLY